MGSFACFEDEIISTWTKNNLAILGNYVTVEQDVCFPNVVRIGQILLRKISLIFHIRKKKH